MKRTSLDRLECDDPAGRPAPGRPAPGRLGPRRGRRPGAGHPGMGRAYPFGGTLHPVGADVRSGPKDGGEVIPVALTADARPLAPRRPRHPAGGGRPRAHGDLRAGPFARPVALPRHRRRPGPPRPGDRPARTGPLRDEHRGCGPGPPGRPGRPPALYLESTRVGDAGLVHLARLTSLETLTLSGTRITDAGLVHLKGLAGLRALDLSWTEVSEAGIEDLRRALPGIEITR